MVASTLVPSYVDFNPRSHEGSDVQSKIVTEQYTISIHAPTRGATIFTGLGIVSDVISIHAPTRGATSAVLLFPVATSNFNPRSHEGSDQSILFNGQRTVQFQSTLPRGERQQFSPKSSLFSQQKLSKIFNLNNKLF